MASSGVAPPAAGGGGAAAAVGNAALHGAQRGAAIAQKGVVNLTIYVQRRGRPRSFMLTKCVSCWRMFGSPAINVICIYECISQLWMRNGFGLG